LSYFPFSSPFVPWLAHLGVHRPSRGRTPSRVHTGVSPIFVFLYLFLSSPSACV
jgi:hypothetical protein